MKTLGNRWGGTDIHWHRYAVFGRHSGPFAKRRAGKLRRKARRQILAIKGDHRHEVSKMW